MSDTGTARPWRDDKTVRSQPPGLVNSHDFVTNDDGVSTQLAQILDQVECETVVVVDDETRMERRGYRRFTGAPWPTTILGAMPESKRRKPKKNSQPRPLVVTSAKKKPPSPTWYVATMAGLMVLGVLLVLFRFVFQLDYSVLILGLVFIGAGFMMTTAYR